MQRLHPRQKIMKQKDLLTVIQVNCLREGLDFFSPVFIVWYDSSIRGNHLLLCVTQHAAPCKYKRCLGEITAPELRWKWWLVKWKSEWNCNPVKQRNEAYIIYRKDNCCVLSNGRLLTHQYWGNVASMMDILLLRLSCIVQPVFQCVSVNLFFVSSHNLWKHPDVKLKATLLTVGRETGSYWSSIQQWSWIVLWDAFTKAHSELWWLKTACIKIQTMSEI